MALTLQDMNPFRIARYIGHATKDIGALCASVKVNRWSKYRPIAAQQDADLTDVQRQALNWGYSVTQYNNLATMLTDARGIGPGKPCWQSTKPSKALCPHFRIHDFIGYDHSAKAPFGWNKPVEGKTYYRSGKLRFSPDSDNLGQLTQAQLPFLKDENENLLKVGVAIRKIVTGTTSNVPNIYVTFTGNTTDFGVDPEEYIINAGTWLNNAAAGTGTYEGCLFFTDQAKTLEGGANTAIFYMIPYAYFTFLYDNATGIAIYGDNIVRNAGGNNSLSFDLHVTQLGDVQPVTGINVYCLAKSTEGVEWEYVNGVFQRVGGGGLQTTASNGIDPATIQRVEIGTVNVASYTRQVQFAIDGNDFEVGVNSSYIIFAEYAVNGYGYNTGTEGLIDDDPIGNQEEMP